MKKEFLPVSGGYELTADSIGNIVPGGTAVMKASLLHTDRDWLPVGDAIVSYKVYSGDGLPEEPAAGSEAMEDISHQGHFAFPDMTTEDGGNEGVIDVGRAMASLNR